MRYEEARAAWQDHFAKGGELVLEPDRQALRRFERNNHTIQIAIVVLAALAAAGIIALADAALGRGATYFLLGVLVVVLLIVARLLHRTRARLRVALNAERYLAVSAAGMTIADVMTVPWDSVVGLVVGDARGRPLRMYQQLTARLWRASGIAEVEVVVGLRKDVPRALLKAAGRQYAPLFELVFEHGGVRIPLDTALTERETRTAIVAIDAAASSVGCGIHVGDGVEAMRAVKTILMGRTLSMASGDGSADTPQPS